MMFVVKDKDIKLQECVMEHMQNHFWTPEQFAAINTTLGMPNAVLIAKPKAVIRNSGLYF
ncbi:MAG: hypothetical protein IPP74_08595 [Alphaproteobacteria bacterium]|nr:hypothetical protein [Alphaproteobacteria bacterium]